MMIRFRALLSNQLAPLHRGAEWNHPDLAGGRERDIGKVVQVDCIRLTLKPPGTKRLKLRYDEAPSIFAFKFNLRRYTSGAVGVAVTLPAAASAGAVAASLSLAWRLEAGAYTRPLLGST
jgi:hypothetical protein